MSVSSRMWNLGEPSSKNSNRFCFIFRGKIASVVFKIVYRGFSPPVQMFFSTLNVLGRKRLIRVGAEAPVNDSFKTWPGPWFRLRGKNVLNTRGPVKRSFVSTHVGVLLNNNIKNLVASWDKSLYRYSNRYLTNVMFCRVSMSLPPRNGDIPDSSVYVITPSDQMSEYGYAGSSHKISGAKFNTKKRYYLNEDQLILQPVQFSELHARRRTTRACFGLCTRFTVTYRFRLVNTVIVPYRQNINLLFSKNTCLS